MGLSDDGLERILSPSLITPQHPLQQCDNLPFSLAMDNRQEPVDDRGLEFAFRQRSLVPYDHQGQVYYPPPPRVYGATTSSGSRISSCSTASPGTTKLPPGPGLPPTTSLGPIYGARTKFGSRVFTCWTALSTSTATVFPQPGSHPAISPYRESQTRI